MTARRAFAAAPTVLLPAVLLLAAGCASTKALKEPRRGVTQEGLASWYGAKYHGRPTASGEIYDMNRISAAHKELPLGTVVEVRNKDNGRKLRVPINDRGPFVKGRIIDLSLAAARKLDMFGAGLARVRIRVVKTAPDTRQLPISYPVRGSPSKQTSKPPKRRPKGAGATAAPKTAASKTAASKTAAAPRHTAAEASSAGGRPAKGGFTIQAGAFSKRSGAAALARRLRSDLDLDRVRIRKSGGLYRVQIDRRRQKAADLVRRKLKEAGIDAIILR